MKAEVLTVSYKQRAGVASGDVINSEMKLKLKDGTITKWYNTNDRYPFDFKEGDIISGLKIRKLKDKNQINYRASRLVLHEGTLKVKGFYNEFQPIRNWEGSKGILEHGDVKTQYVKLGEEVGELGKAIINEDGPEIKDAIGDACVVLTSLAHLAGFKIEDCINAAYDVISKRTGKMENGSFIKDK